MRSSLGTRDKLLAIWTLDIVFKLLILRRLVILKPTAAPCSCTCKLLLSAEDFGAPLSINVQDLNAVEIGVNRLLLTYAPSRLLLLLALI